jgi:cell division protein ZapA
MKQLEVQIMGQNYLLGCPEDGDARLLEAVERVDTMMCKIRETGKVRARDRIAVLTAVNFAFDLANQPAALSSDASQPGASSVTAGPVPETPDLRLTLLLARLDAALGDDQPIDLIPSL